MKNRNIIYIVLVTAGILLVPFVAMRYTDEVVWTLLDFIIAGFFLFGTGILYELISRISKKTTYRAAVATGLLGALLLLWVNGAVGIIGSENNPANLLYGAVFAVGLAGALVSRLRPRGMEYTMFAAALVQFSVPLFALFVWPAQTSWGAPGVVGVLVFNSFFPVLFFISALLFRHARTTV